MRDVACDTFRLTRLLACLLTDLQVASAVIFAAGLWFQLSRGFAVPFPLDLTLSLSLSLSLSLTLTLTLSLPLQARGGALS